MIYRHQFPVVRILLPFVAGIVLALLLGSTTVMVVITTILFWLLLLLYAVFTKKLWTYKTRWFFGAMAASFMLLLGYSLSSLQDAYKYHNHFSKTTAIRYYIAEVAEPLLEKEHTYKTVLKVKHVVAENGVHECSGKILAYFRKDPALVYPRYGQTIIFDGIPNEIDSPRNPGAFDYRKYMASANIQHQVFLTSGQWLISDARTVKTLRSRAQGIRDYFLGILRNNGLAGQEYAVAAALILGQEDNLDAETYREYAGAGVMHILSVSGLHVGIVFLVLNFLLGFLNHNRKLIILKTIIIILAIWFYALITGLSPSVARSAAMFSIVLLAVLVNRNSHIINSLSISALILLAYNPYYLLNIGFQLSYIALAGIVFIYDLIYQRWAPATWLAQKIWQIVAVSLAAQIATIPISLYYFHQFPSYFLAANIVAIPLSSLVIYSGMLVLFTSFIPSVSGFVGHITVLLLKLLNGSISWIENLPFAVISDIPFRMSEMLILYVVLILALTAIAFRHKRSFFLAVTCLVCFVVVRIAFQFDSHNQKKFIVYAAGKNSVIQFIDGVHSYLLADSLFKANSEVQRQILDRSNTTLGIRRSVFLPGINQHGLAAKSEIPLAGNGKYFLFNNRMFAFLDEIPAGEFKGECLKVDYLVLSGNLKGNLESVLTLFEPDHIILDGNFPYRKGLRWTAEGQKAGIEIYNVRQQGAFIEEL